MSAWVDWLRRALPLVEVPVEPDRGVVDGLGLARVIDVTTFVVTLADAMAAVHALRPPLEVRAAAPDAQPAAVLACAERRVAVGAVDPNRWDAPYAGRSPDELLALARQCLPPPARTPTVVLGSAATAHLRIGPSAEVLGWAPAAVEGVLPAGWGDPYRDLATVANELARVVSPELLGPFFDRYGLAAPELARLDHHLLVDQLLR